MKKILSIFAAMLIAGAVYAAVDPGAGALSAAIEAAVGGAVIELNSGDFTEADAFNIAKDITIKAAAGQVPVVKPTGIGITNGSKVIFDGVKIDCSAATDHVIYANDNSADKSLTLEGCEVYGFTNNSSVIYTEQKLDTCIINNCNIHNIEKSIMFYNGGSGKYVSITNSTFANITPTNESSYWTAAIYPTTATKIRIDNCTFYNCYSMGSYGTINLSASDVVVSNCILAMPADKEKRCIYNSSGNVMNCLTHHYTKSGTKGGIASGPTITGCDEISNVDPLFADAASSDFSLAENSPAKGAGVGGTHLGDPRWWHANWETAETVDVESVELDAEELALDVNETSFLHATVLPAGASDPSVTWTSSNDAIATIVNGAVKGLAAGTVTITAKSNSDNSKSATCEVTVSDVIPSTDFAAPYFLKGTKAKLEGNIYISEADSLNYKDKSVCGTATWKINALAGGVIKATANYKIGSASGALLRIVILDEDENQVGDSLKHNYYEKDGDKELSGFVVLPKAGEYTIKLVNVQKFSSAKLKGITLTKDATKDVIFKGGWDSWTEHPATIAQDGLSASATIELPVGDYEFGLTVGDDFRANGWWLKPEGPTSTSEVTGNTGNMRVFTAFNLEHTFTWTYATNTIEVTYPEVTVYFINESDWTKVHAYAWRGDSKNHDWPGVELEKTGSKSNGHDIYSYTISAYNKIIFSNDGSNQTANLDIDPENVYYYGGEWHNALPSPATAIDNAEVNGKAVKSIENGMLIIIKNGVKYNAQGAVVK